MGPKACIDCHKTAIAAWEASRHAVDFEKTLGSDKAKDFAPKVGVSLAEIAEKVSAWSATAKGRSAPPTPPLRGCPASLATVRPGARRAG